MSDPADPSPIFLTLQSADVIYRFWVSEWAGKPDLIPDKTNRLWTDPRRPGLYVGQCPELYGFSTTGCCCR